MLAIFMSYFLLGSSSNDTKNCSHYSESIANYNELDFGEGEIYDSRPYDSEPYDSEVEGSSPFF